MKQLVYFFLFLGLFLVLPFYVVAQNPSPASIHYTVKDGLLSNTTYGLHQDKEGFIWIGTDKGVNRFDSYKMRAFTTGNGLSDNDILSIHQDSEGRVWFLTYNGKLSYWKENKIHNPNNTPSLSQISSNSFYSSFLEDKDKNIWFGTDHDGLIQIESATNLKPHFFKEREFSIDYLFQNNKGEICFLTNKGIHRKKIDESELVFKSSFSGQRRACYDSKNDLLFFCDFNLLHCYSFKEKKVLWKKKIEGVKLVNKIEQHSDQFLYLSTDQGIFSFDQTGNLQQQFLAEEQISDVLFDHEGNLWASSLHNGVFLINNKEVVNYYIEAKHSILKHEGKIFFGGEKMKIHSISNNQLDTISFQTNHIKWLSKQERIQVLLADSNIIWAGSSKGLFKLENEKVICYSATVTNDLFLDQDFLYQAANSGTFRLSNTLLDSMKEFISDSIPATPAYNTFRKQISAVTNNRSFCFLKLKNGAQLVGTSEGIVAMNDSTQSLQNKYLIKGKVVAMKRADNQEDFWVLVENGLYIYHSSQKRFKPILSSFNKEKLVYTSMAVDGKGQVWLGSNKGVFFLIKERDRYSLKHVSYNNGLASEDINELAAINDTIWLATSKGVTSFPQKSLEYIPQPLLSIDSVYVNDTLVSYENLQHLSSAKNTLSVYITGISYKDRGELMFHYSLKGESNRTGISKDRKLVLSDLPASAYTLEVYGLNSNGIKSNTSRLNFKISLIWWQNWKFWLIFTIILVAVSIAIIRFNKKTNLEEIQEQLNQQKERFIIVKSVTAGAEVKVMLRELYYIKAAGDYIELFLEKNSVLVRMTMKDMMLLLENSTNFERVHKSYIVNITLATSLHSDGLKIQEIIVPISRAKRGEVKSHFASKAK